MPKQSMSVLFLGKEGDPHATTALDFCRKNFATVTAHLGSWGDAFPSVALDWSGDLIISYLSRWVVPASLLARANTASINFHPAPPEFPGFGCASFALYQGVSSYGVTCHHMAATVDTGPIIRVVRFPVLESDDLASLLARSYVYQLVLFFETITALLQGKRLDSCNSTWSRKPYTKRELDDSAVSLPTQPKKKCSDASERPRSDHGSRTSNSMAECLS